MLSFLWGSNVHAVEWFAESVNHIERNRLICSYHVKNFQVHGGTTAQDIYEKVEEAQRRTEERPQLKHRRIYTVLFFDEANTTEAVGAIKEVMCDRAIRGRSVTLHKDLKMIAACNPYRQ
jgi:hypothetical protein